MTSTEQQFIRIIRTAMNTDSLPETIDWKAVWDLACRHHLETVVYGVLKDHPELPETLRKQMFSVYNRMTAREIRQEYCMNQIEAALQGAGIHYAILKGGILRADYPGDYTRFMSDLDFYIKPEDRKDIRATMESIGGVFRGTESGDEQFLFSKNIGVEFHGRLLYRKTKYGIENYPEWGFVNERRDRLSEEGYALNLIGHAVYDLSRGGPGVRYILDLWVYRNLHCQQPDWKAVDERLEEDGIYGAAHNLLDLSEYLFGTGEESPLMEEMAAYILKGGLHGDYKRLLASQTTAGNAVLRQLFRNRTEFENRFPWLIKYPYLLPVAWVLRIAGSMKRNKSFISKWLRDISSISKKEIDSQREQLARFGL